MIVAIGFNRGPLQQRIVVCGKHIRPGQLHQVNMQFSGVNALIRQRFLNHRFKRRPSHRCLYLGSQFEYTSIPDITIFGFFSIQRLVKIIGKFKPILHIGGTIHFCILTEPSTHHTRGHTLMQFQAYRIQLHF